ncbi:4-aminobutyrate--2-oxoglutarate transaminase [Bartonella sp. DGB2]|uniref:4-aminobutyrate--2-oxoglutarate transaminase n=1 Tax=Bartonella sp. DGB2 TaxID=3388426 RepID=UPI00398FD2E4
MQNETLTKRRSNAITKSVGVSTPIFIKKARNSELWDVEGRRYIDFASGIAVLNTGHCHPHIMEAVTEQLKNFTHSCHQVVPYENYVTLAEELNQRVPGDFIKKTFFTTTGAEAVENAIKIARSYTGRDAVIAFSGAFHGRTFMGMALTGKVAPYKTGFGSMPNGVYHIPFPTEVHNITSRDSIQALNTLLRSDVSPQRVAAIILEPVQGEGGFYPAPAELMRAIRTLCDEHGIVMIADEVQTGFARTGKVFAMEHYDINADLICMAKSLAGGFPLSAVTGRAEIMDAPVVGGLGGTYGGNPVAIAAALAVLEVIDKEDLCNRAQVLGTRLHQKMVCLQKDVPEIRDIRGPGFMKAIEFFNQNGEPCAQFTDLVRKIALEKGLILLSCGVYGNVIRFLAPLTIEDLIFDEALEILEDSIRTAKQQISA